MIRANTERKNASLLIPFMKRLLNLHDARAKQESRSCNLKNQGAAERVRRVGGMWMESTARAAHRLLIRMVGHIPPLLE
jgi:muconolactone delta-isomerase